MGILVGAPVCGIPRGPVGSCRTARTINMTVSALTTIMWKGKAGMCRISFAVISVSPLALGRVKNRLGPPMRRIGSDPPAGSTWVDLLLNMVLLIIVADERR